MPSEFPLTPFPTNKNNGFTALLCKIANVFSVPYGFTAWEEGTGEARTRF
jgi:hypothetical protein